MSVSDELFHEELVAMHLQEQDFRAQHSSGWANWFGSKPDERRKYRLRAKLMIQEAREPRG